MDRTKITCVWGMRLCSPFLENASGKMGLCAWLPWPPSLMCWRCSCHVFHPQVRTCCCVSPSRIPISLGGLILPSTFSTPSLEEGDTGPALAKHLTLTSVMLEILEPQFTEFGGCQDDLEGFLKYNIVWWVPAPIGSDPVSWGQDQESLTRSRVILMPLLQGCNFGNHYPRPDEEQDSLMDGGRRQNEHAFFSLPMGDVGENCK